MLFSKKPVYQSPGGAYYKLYEHMAQQTHLLIAGTTGSGKSVIINGIIYTCLLHTPDRAGLILIDPKRVELYRYRNCPHTHVYATEPEDMVKALQYALQLIDQRYRIMQRNEQTTYPGGDVYVIIDELADLMTTDRKHVQPLIQRICQIGRAAKVHVIAATQCPIVEVIPTPIKCNFDSRVGLHVWSPQDSRNILGVTGCEQLPLYGQGYYKTPKGMTLYNIPMYEPEKINAIVRYWTSKACLYKG